MNLRPGLAPASYPARFIWGLVVGLELTLLQARVGYAAPEILPSSRFDRTTAAVMAAGDKLRVDFADAVLGQLVEVYAGEADLARKQANDSAQPARLRGWAQAVDGYARQLLLVLDDVRLGFPVQVLPGQAPGAPAALAIAGRTVMLSHPRAEQQQALEQSVLRDFCSLQDCAALVGDATEVAAIPVSPAWITPAWQFGPDGPSCSYGGLQLHFSSEREIARLKELCAQLMHEVTALETEIRWQGVHDVNVEWAQLAISPSPQGREHMLRLNRSGDALLLPLPLLAQSTGLLAELTPWLRQRLNGVASPELSIQAADYQWPVR